MEKNLEKFCLVGSEIGYSLSTMIHNFIFNRDKVNASYEIVDIPWDQLTQSRFTDLLENYRGFNVTTPFKTRVTEYLKGNLGSNAKLTGSVNTVDVNPVLGITGYNTDVTGLRQGVMDIITAQTIFPVKLILLGGGGVARSVIYSFVETHERYKTKQVPLITVFLRDPDKNTGLVNMMAGMQFKQLKVHMHFQEWNGADIGESLNQGGLIVNATPRGSLSSDNKMAFDFSNVTVDAGKQIVAADLVYNPSETIFLKTAKDAGAYAIGGLGMLVYQAVASLEKWLGKKVSESGIFEMLSDKGHNWFK